MANAIVYIINSENIIIRKFEYDFEEAMSRFHRKRATDGRYHIMLKGVEPPYIEKTSEKFKKMVMSN